MLGAGVELAADTPLFDSDLDLDSLDALLLMQSLEKEFGFKISSEEFGPDIFKDVNRLAQFAHEQRLDANRTVAE